MALKIQYNKTALQQINKQLKVRLRALPTLKSKESALRLEVKKAKDEVVRLTQLYNDKLKQSETLLALWVEFQDDLILVENVIFNSKKIAGVVTPVLEDVVFATRSYSLFNSPAWYSEGLVMVKDIVKLAIERDFFVRKTEILNQARKKTTQKVNLYEKVQIPEFEDGIRKIKRFMEDEDNLSKSAQKIVKSRQQMMEEEV